VDECGSGMPRHLNKRILFYFTKKISGELKKSKKQEKKREEKIRIKNGINKFFFICNFVCISKGI